MDGALPRSLRIANWVAVPGVYVLTAAAVGVMIARARVDWRWAIKGEWTPAVWLSCSLLLTAGVIAAIVGLVQLLAPDETRPSRATTLAWFACAGAMLLADLDERFVIHEYFAIDFGPHVRGEEHAHTHIPLILYALCASGFSLIVFRRYRSSPATKAIFVLGVVCFALSILIETVAFHRLRHVLEEFLEFAAAASFVASFFLALTHELAGIMPGSASAD